jgi:aerobic carbon-monoxide dehydrogenase large subunit
MARVTGRPVRRVEDPRFLAGTGRYVEDVQPDRVVYLGFVRSPYPSARITSIDTSAAKQAPGVHAVITAEDIPNLPDVPSIPLPFVKIPPFPVLARGRVAMYGAPVAAVVADTAAQARDAADLVTVDYEPIAGVASAEEAIAADAPRVHSELDSNFCYTLKREGGDVEKAFAEADKVVHVRVDNPRVAPIPMEPRGCVAEPGEHPTLTMWVSTQAPHGAKFDLARVLNLPPDEVRVIAPDVGGGFGAKTGATPEYILAGYFALQLGRPVKWVASRSEDIAVTTQGRDMLVYVDLAAKSDGTITGLKMRKIANLGAHLHSATAIPPTFVLNMASGCYRIPNVSVETSAVFTNTPSTGPYRGAGRPESVLAIERGIDFLARDLGMDPIELRRKNFIRPQDFPYKSATGAEYDSGDYAGALEKALQLVHYQDLVGERETARAKGELMGIGVSTFVEPSGSVGGETGLVRVEQDGKVTLVTGSHSHGQGHETSFAQIIADEMQVPLHQVRVIHGDTAAIDRGTGTFASRSMSLGGSAGLNAARRVVEKARRLAGSQLEVTLDDVQQVEGGFAVAGAPSRSVTWKELATIAQTLPTGEEPGLEAHEAFDIAEMWPFGTHIAVVRIDRDTGDTVIDRIVAVDDCGNVVNPMIVEGQMHGGIAQAVGQAMIERVVFDERGQMLSGSMGDYAVPRAGDIPDMVLDHTVTPTPLNPLGAKGVGEAGTNGCPPAIANAILDALSPLGVRHLDLPFTADRIWEAIQSASK